MNLFFSLTNLYWVFWGLVRCLQVTKWLPAAGACPDQVEHVMVGPHVSLLVEEKVTPKWTVLWLSQRFDSFNVLQWCHNCCSELEIWSILLVFYCFSQDICTHPATVVVVILKIKITVFTCLLSSEGCDSFPEHLDLALAPNKTNEGVKKQWNTR